MAKRTKIVFSSNSQLAHVWAQQTIGHFMGNAVKAIDNDEVLTIGCHRILYSEAKTVLGPLLGGALKLVGGVA